MNTHITPNAQPLYTFQNRAGDFVDVLARAEYQGEQVDVTRTDNPAHLPYCVSGTKLTSRYYKTAEAAAAAFDAVRLVTLAAKFGTYEYAKP